MSWQALSAGGEDRELTMVRTLRAPRALAWRCFEDPDLLRQWWGPEGFSVAALRMDFRPGGHWHVTIRSPDGVDFASNFTFDAIVPPERLVYRNSAATGPEWKGNPPALYTATLTFQAQGETETLLTLRFAFRNAAEKADSIERGFGRGTSASLDKLDRLLAAPSTDPEQDHHV